MGPMRPILLVASLCLAGCSGEVLGSFDTSPPAAVDADAPVPDGAVVVPLDAGTPVPTDASQPGADASLPLSDSGAPSDAASPGTDAASPGADASTTTPPDASSPCPDAGTTPAPDLWVTAYIAGWNLNVPPNAAYGTMPGTEVDYTAFTHGILFNLPVDASGSLNGIADWDTFAPDRIRSAVGGAHAASRPILFSVGGGGNTAFATAIATSAGRTKLVGEILSVLTTWGFDGVDLDLEPIRASDEPNFTALVQALSPALAAKSTPMLPKPLLTAACNSTNAAMYASLASSFDQINLMTYDMAGTWDGWVTWHNSALYDGGFRFPSSGGLIPSSDGMVDELLAAGVPAKKIGIGIDFYGYVWKGGAGMPSGGATAPRQSWTTAPTVQDNLSYADIMSTYYQASRYHWDTAAEAAYLSIDDASDANDKFISYDDATTAQKKVDYVKSKGIGGLIIWELSGAYLPSAPAGQRDPLLQALRTAAGL